MRIKLAALTIAIALLMLLPSRVKADTFQYDYTSGTLNPFGIPGTVNIVFTITAATLPTFGDITSFTSTTDPFGTITAFAWSSGPSASQNCLLETTFGPACAAFTNAGNNFGGAADNFAVGSFLSPGTYTANDGSGTTLVITDLGSAVPEPSSLLLLGCGLFGLLAIAKFRLRRIGAQPV